MMSINNLSRFCFTLRQRGCIRCLQTAARRRADESQGDDNSKSDKPQARVTGTAASDLLNVLADFKVQKTTPAEGPEDSKRKRVSAAANFQRMVSRAEERKQTQEKDVSEEEEEEFKSPGLEDIQEMTVEAAKKVAEVYPNREIVESDLLKELRRHDEASAAGERGEIGDMDSVLSGIRVQRQASTDKRQDRPDARTGGQRAMPAQYDVAFSSGGPGRQDFEEEGRSARTEPYQRQRKRALFERQRLNIFTPVSETESQTQEIQTQRTSIWELELQKQLRALSYSTIRNGFEEAMRLTEEGKLWKYPIDNEQGMEEEQNVGFHEHVFLDHLLADFPKRVQVLDFMELVLIGLSKNPFLTVAQKQEHVAWFRDYFWKKEDVFDRAEEAEKGKASGV